MSTVNRNQLSEITGMHVKTIDSKVEREDLPFVRRPGVDGAKEWLYDTVKVIEWMTGRVEAATQTDTGKDAKMREQVANAGLKELDLAERLGFLIDRDIIAQHVTAGDSIVKSRLLAVPGRLSQSISFETDPAVCERMMREEINSALAELEKDWSERG